MPLEAALRAPAALGVACCASAWCPPLQCQPGEARDWIVTAQCYCSKLLADAVHAESCHKIGQKQPLKTNYVQNSITWHLEMLE